MDQDRSDEEDADWTWRFTPRVTKRFEGLDTHIQVSFYHALLNRMTTAGYLGYFGVLVPSCD